MNKKNATTLTLLLFIAVSVSLLNAIGLMDEHIIPFGDAGGFYNYALKLYGHVHTGQWANAFSTLAEPSKNFFPTSFFFLFLPEHLANSTGYGLLNNLSWHIMTMFGIWIFLRTLGYEKFTIPLFLLVSVNNYALDPTYYYYMDLPFMGLSLLGLSLSAGALKQQTRKSIILAGIFTALPFLGKPPNALISAALTVFFIGGVWLTTLISKKSTNEWRSLFRFAGFWAAGFAPIFILASLCGGLEAIIDVIYLNSASGVFYSELSATGFKRALYFPLCLTFYYSLPLILGFLITLSAFRFIPALKSFSTQTAHTETCPTRKSILCWMALVFILFWGLHFSFILKNKLIRSLPLMLPILWIILFTATPLQNLRQRIVMPICLIFFLLPFTQASIGFMVNKQNRNPETYQLEGDWLNRWPSKKPNLALGTETTDQLYTLLKQSNVHAGKVAVGTEMASWNAHALSNWCNQESLRRGRPAAFDYVYICPGRFTTPLRSSMENANALLLILEPRIQYNRNLYQINIDLANYAMNHWNNKIAKVNVMYNGNKQPSVCIVAFKEPLNGDALSQLEKDLYPNGFSSRGDQRDAFKSMGLMQKINYLKKQDKTSR